MHILSQPFSNQQEEKNHSKYFKINLDVSTVPSVVSGSTRYVSMHCNGQPGFIQARLCKFKDFSRTSKILSYCFQGLKTTENTDLHVKILLRKCYSPLLKILVKENKYKIVVPLFDAAYAAPNKGTTIYTDLGLLEQR